MTSLNPESVDRLVERIVELTRSPQSIPFYRNAIAKLGEGAIEMELGELRYQVKLGEVEEPGRYFTKLLKDRLPEASTNSPKPVQHQRASSHLSDSPLQLFDELRAIPAKKENEVDQT